MEDLTKLRTLAALSPLVLATPAHAAPVTWDFVETGITFCATPALCSFTVPFVLATLILPDETSSGHTTFQAAPFSSHPIKVGDDFIFSMQNFAPVSQTLPRDGVPQAPSLFGAQDFNISWNEVPGEPLSVSVDVNGTFDNARLSGTQGFLASDRTLGGCTLTQCTVSGFWNSPTRETQPLPVSEPSMLGLLAAALIGFIGLGWHRDQGISLCQNPDTTQAVTSHPPKTKSVAIAALSPAITTL